MASVGVALDIFTSLPESCIFTVCQFLLGDRSNDHSEERALVLSSRVSKAWNMCEELIYARVIASPRLRRKIFEAKIQARIDYPRDLLECFAKGGFPIYRMPVLKPDKELETLSPGDMSNSIMKFKTVEGLSGISILIRAESPSRRFEERVLLGMEKRLVNVVLLTQRSIGGSEWMNTWGNSLDPSMRALFDRRHHQYGEHDPRNLYNTCCPFNQRFGINRNLLLRLLRGEDPDFTIHSPIPIRAQELEESKDSN